MAILNTESQNQKETLNIIPIFLKGFIKSLIAVKNIPNVESLYLYEDNENLHVYVFCHKEDFDNEKEIIRTLNQWVPNYCYIPEIHTFALDKIENKKDFLPSGVAKFG